MEIFVHKLLKRNKEQFSFASMTSQNIRNGQGEEYELGPTSSAWLVNVS